MTVQQREDERKKDQSSKTSEGKKLAILILLVGGDFAANAALGGEFGNSIIIRNDVASEFNIVISKLSKLSVIDTENLRLLGTAEGKTGNKVHNEKDNAGTTEGVGEASNGVSKLVCKLNVMTVDPSTRDFGSAIEMGYVVRGEDTSQQVANNSANTMLSKDIKGVVDMDEELELGGIVACGSTDDSVDDGSPWGDISRTWSDSDKASNDARAEADGRPLLLKTVVKQAPSDSTDSSSDVGNQTGHDSTNICGTSRTTVESKPSDPEEDSAENDMSDVMWAVVEFMSSVSASLSEHERVGQSSRPRGNMDWSSTGEI
jgi:hypothetical protein